MNEESIFLEALGMDDLHERAQFLDRACAGDTVQRERIEKLLATHPEAGNFLEQPVSPLGGTIDEAPAAVCQAVLGSEQPGLVLAGQYKLLEQIGEGGMGRVWMAQQTEPVKRLVALKLIKAGMDSKQVIARFEAERQALALMDHANIARVLDAGTSGAGRPYFVMDLVKGVPITKYCDEHHLTPRQRLELFVPVCSAVQHAHQKGIIHRDLKPSNVMIALYDGKPVPKVIDFGIAKATGQQLTERTLVTGFGAVVGTLEYMSPEQAELNQLDIDTRSDIYSLGVLLYELLTGTTPLDRKHLKAGALLEVLRIIREEEPPRPSTRLSESKDTLPSISAQRQTEPAKLARLVRGELDWIVMKAIDKDRNRRYETANGFAQDIQRYLADEPVQACPPSAWYRFGKFARRNKGRLAATGLILFFIAVLAGIFGWVVGDRAVRKQRLTARVEQILDDMDRLEREQKWAEALAAADRAEAALDGSEADGAIRRRLADARRDMAFVAQLDRIRQDRVTVTEEQWNNLEAESDYVQAFREYGVDVETLPAEETIARLQVKPALAVPVAAALDDWAAARRSLGKEAPTWEPLVAVARGLDPDPLRDRLRATWSQPITPGLKAELRQLAESIDVKTQSPATIDTLAVTLHRAQLASSATRILQDGQYAHPADFWLNNDLGLSIRYSRNDVTGALRYFSNAVSIRPDSARAWNNLGIALGELAKVGEAIACLRRASELDPNWALVHNNLGRVLKEKGDLDGALAEYREAIRLKQDYGRAHVGLGNVLFAQGKLDAAIAEYHESIRLDPNYAFTHNNLGVALHRKGDLDAAIGKYRDAIRLKKDYAEAHKNLGDCLQVQGQFNEAISEYHEAIRLQKDFAGAHGNLGIALRAKGRIDEAIAEYRLAIALKPDDPSYHFNLGRALRQRGEFRKALKEFRRGHELGSKRPGWRYPSAQWVRQYERLVELDEKLPGFLERKATPASAAERIELAGLCILKRLDGAAARFYEEAFAAEPKLADDLGAAHRYNAACAAALAGCGRGKDAAGLDDKERGRLRRQALAWLRADLEAWCRLLDKDPGKLRSASVGVLQHWLADPDFVGVRGPEALAKLPEAERQPWQKLWDDAAKALARAQAKTTPEKKPDAK
jgi:serine/threonine protein kinase/Flp pilus assembly protein TadD